VIGGGSNILASDKGFRGLIVVPRIDFLEIEGTSVKVGATRSLAQFVDETAAEGLAGLESLAGIAGTVGGAIVGNAGAYGQSISDTLVEVELYNPSRGLHAETREKLGFKYRHSDLKGSQNVVLSGLFKLVPGDRKALMEKTEEIKQIRSKRHPHEDISAGCFFKNVEDTTQPHGKLAAGFLLEQIGAKELTIGKAGVYPNHANILINKGGATASQVRQLSLELKRRVKEEYGIELSEEVVLLGDFS
jgi:UDP-N-acetylmuramate dehydrogenase